MKKGKSTTNESAQETKVLIREFVDASIFDEMSAKFPTNEASTGIEYKQKCAFAEISSDYDFPALTADCIELGISTCETFTVYMYLLCEMAGRNGYWMLYNMVTPCIICSSLAIDPTHLQPIINYLISANLIFYDAATQRLTSPIAVYNFERLQKKRTETRNRVAELRKEKAEAEKAAEEKKEARKAAAAAKRKAAIATNKK